MPGSAPVLFIWIGSSHLYLLTELHWPQADVWYGSELEIIIIIINALLSMGILAYFIIGLCASLKPESFVSFTTFWNLQQHTVAHIFVEQIMWSYLVVFFFFFLPSPAEHWYSGKCNVEALCVVCGHLVASNIPLRNLLLICHIP